MAASDHLHPEQFEGIDRAAEEGRKMDLNPAAQREKDFNDYYDSHFPRPDYAVNATEPGA